ncbi:CD225/dispanin family protein [Demequina sp. NBRC 110053]|uniref:CD225/dispanin family protein n=1 Tax=Demequina sp. NBRC 110053 TaxID=1570342 RepID=UPI00190E8D31|nr:CD225/dispanin family protein [Demequina sp. NBRC 110053]
MSDITPPPPPPPAAGPPPVGGNGQPPNNNLVLAIITTVLCCLPLGIWAIVKAAEVNGKWERGDHAGAQESADTAKKVSFWGIGIGLVVGIGYLALLLGGALSFSAAGS